MKLYKYIFWAFLLGWIGEGIGCYFAYQGNTMIYQLCLIVTMFMPTAAIFLSGHTLKGLGWKPSLRSKIKYYLFAWLGPAVLSILGAVLFFVIFPNTFDAQGSALSAIAGEEVITQLEKVGLSPTAYLLLSAVSAITYAPVINTFISLGEETGWRGIMYPVLKEKYGKTPGRILGGIIWGIWHWPLIILVGYEYGTGYFGAPFTGLIVFCLSTVVMGTLTDYVYEKTESIWAPSLMHGAFNAFTIPLYFLHAEALHLQILGPLGIGLIGMIPMLAVACIILKKPYEKKI